MIDFASVSKQRVLFVGDAIMDEYVHVRVVGKAIKDNALSAVLVKSESFRGGVWAAAAHAANLCAHVDVLTGPTMMWSSRMVEATYLGKLFVTHGARPIPDFVAKDFDVGSYDLVVVTDFGYGMMTPELIRRVVREAKFLAVNAQTNAMNFGFNSIKRYPHADLVVIDQIEARLGAGLRDAPMEQVMVALGFPRVIVTMGADGIAGHDGERTYHQPAQVNKPTDTIGAGDAVLAVTAPFAAAGASMTDLLAVGNAAGAAKVGIVGHRSSVSVEQLRHFMGTDNERTTG